MRCQKCGKRLRENEKFCTVCGYYNDGKDDNDWNDDFDDDFDLTKEDDETEEELINKSSNNFDLKADSSGTKDDEFYYKNENLLEAYIGEDYRLIKRNWFNIFACILNWMYILYRKMYLIGILGLTLTGYIFLKYKFTITFFIYLVIVMCFLGLVFNKIYIFHGKLKVEHLKKKYEGTDEYTLINICKKKGGVNFVIALIIYLIFLVIMILCQVTISYNKNHNEAFWKENTENEATCTSLIKTAYNDLENHELTGEIDEAVCRVKSASKKNYSLYLKLTISKKTVYVYYQTEDNYLVYKNSTKDLTDLQTKQMNNEITEEEQEIYDDIKTYGSTYLEIVSNSKKEEDLITNKTNTEERLNYVITADEITR